MKDIQFDVFSTTLTVFPSPFSCYQKPMQVIFICAILQIAERRKLVSSIKDSMIDTEGNKQPYVENKASVSSLDAAAKTQGNDTNQDHKLN